MVAAEQLRYGHPVYLLPELYSGIDYETVPLKVTELPPGFLQTPDFPLGDLWSVGLRATLVIRTPEHKKLLNPPRFRTKSKGSVLELGPGDNRNWLELSRAGINPAEYVGVEIDPKKIALGVNNLNKEPSFRNVPWAIHNQDAISYLKQLENNNELFYGLVIICLPQVALHHQVLGEQGATISDLYEINPLLKPFAETKVVDELTIDDYGFTLNAAALAYLRPTVAPGTQVIIALNHRVKRYAREFIIRAVGNYEPGYRWEIIKRFKTEPIQHDPLIMPYSLSTEDDKGRYLELNEDGNYVEIPIALAQERVSKSVSVAIKKLAIDKPLIACDEDERDSIRAMARHELGQSVLHSVGYYILEAR